MSNITPNTQVPAQMPQHIAIIMDGNNRYGKVNSMGKGEGHIAGKHTLDIIVEHCARTDIEVLTVFAFSSENWQRPQYEVDLLMSLLEHTIHEQLPRMIKHDIRMRFIGDRTQLDPKLQQLMKSAEAQTAKHSAMTLVIAVSYGGQWDIANASQQLAKQVAEGTINAEDINQELLAQHISLADLPAVDMLIRTGGDYRISNFLLWQTAYAELFFTPTLWPDFSIDELQELLTQFNQRQRRFGKTSEQVEQSIEN